MKRKLAFLGAILLAAFIFTYEGNTYQTHALDEEDQAWIEEARGGFAEYRRRPGGHGTGLSVR